MRYTPTANYSGSDTFTYTISDGNGGTAQAAVTLTISEVNDPPVAGADSRTINEDTSLTLNVSDLIANDTAGPGETGQTLSVISVDGASVGTVSLQGSTMTFTPPANFFGTATFNYTVRDNGTTNGVADPKSAVGTVTVTVSPVNDDPTAVDDSRLGPDRWKQHPDRRLGERPDRARPRRDAQRHRRRRRHTRDDAGVERQSANTLRPPTSREPTASPTPSATATVARARPR